MSKYILILTQDPNNQSVALLEKSLKQAQTNLKEKLEILNWDVSKTQMIGDDLCQLSYENFIGVRKIVKISDIALGIKRTWGPIRKQAISICQKLEEKNVPILNGSRFIEWSHSKIDQYETLKNTALFPKTRCFGKEIMADIYTENVQNKIEQVISHVQGKLQFPLVLKTDKGCRADGVYLVRSIPVLKELLNELFMQIIKNKTHEIKDGFLLQEFIVTHPNEQISNYYRINIVNGEPQSAVQFQLKWSMVKGFSYEKLSDFEGHDDKPMDLSFFPKEDLESIVFRCPCKNGVVGADILYYNDEMYLLEFNDGPVISSIVELSNTEKPTEKNLKAIEACRDFPMTIASLCLNHIKKRQLNHHKLLTSKL